jgi:ribosomal protein L37AE/L43A
MIRSCLSGFASGNREFDLHLHVLEHACHSREPRYTIAIWERTDAGPGLRAICHIQPLAEALAAIMAELRKRVGLAGQIGAMNGAQASNSDNASDACTMKSNTPACRACGFPTRSNGSCFVCGNCGASTGCS